LFLICIVSDGAATHWNVHIANRFHSSSINHCQNLALSMTVCENYLVIGIIESHIITMAAIELDRLVHKGEIAKPLLVHDGPGVSCIPIDDIDKSAI